MASPAVELPVVTFRRVLRSAPALMKSPAAGLPQLAQDHGPNFVLLAWPVRVVVLGDAQLIQDLLRQPEDRFRWSRVFWIIKAVTGRTGILAAEPAEHARIRPLVRAALRIDHADLCQRVGDEVAAIAKHMEGGRSVDLDDMLRAATRRILIGTVLAVRGDMLGRVAEVLDPLLNFPDTSIPSQLWPLPGGARYRARRARRRFESLLRSVDLPPAWRQVEASTGSRDVLVDQLVTVIAAGEDATSATGTSAAHRLLHAPPGDERTTSASHSDRDAQVKQAIDDTIARRPPSAVGAREVAAESIDVGGIRIPRGTIVLWSPLIASSEAAGCPARTEEPDRHNSAFGYGPRRCVGRDLAQALIPQLLGELFTTLEMQPTTSGSPQPKGLFVTRPRGGLDVGPGDPRGPRYPLNLGK